VDGEFVYVNTAGYGSRSYYKRGGQSYGYMTYDWGLQGSINNMRGGEIVYLTFDRHPDYDVSTFEDEFEYFVKGVKVIKGPR